MAFELETLLEICVKAGASDMHLQEGKPPVYRVNGNSSGSRASRPWRTATWCGSWTSC